MKKNAWLALTALLLTLGAAPTPKSNTQGAKVSIEAHLTKTALWVGDTLTYTIRAVYDHDVELALDHLKKESLALAPFVVRAVAFEHGEWSSNKKLLEITLQLATYETGKSELTIPPIPLYYFIREAGVGRRESQAETLQVPAARIGLRSTLSLGPPKPRDFKPLVDIDPMRIVIPFFLGLAGLSFVGSRGARWAWKILRVPKAKRRTFGRRAREKLVQDNLAKIRSIGSESDEDFDRFYHAVSRFLRQYLEERLELEVFGLTPEEIEKALEQAGTGDSLAQQISAILQQCEAVRYRSDGPSVARERRGDVQQAFEKAVTALKET